MHFTGLARNRLRLYHLTGADVVGAVRQGKIIAADVAGKFYAWRQNGDRWLRVTYFEDSRGVKILTVAMFETGPPDE